MELHNNHIGDGIHREACTRTDRFGWNRGWPPALFWKIVGNFSPRIRKIPPKYTKNALKNIWFFWIQNYHFSAKDWSTSYMKRLQLQTHPMFFHFKVKKLLCTKLRKCQLHWNTISLHHHHHHNQCHDHHLPLFTARDGKGLFVTKCKNTCTTTCKEGATRFWIVKPAKWEYVRPIADTEDTDTDPLQI